MQPSAPVQPGPPPLSYTQSWPPVQTMTIFCSRNSKRGEVSTLKMEQAGTTSGERRLRAPARPFVPARDKIFTQARMSINTSLYGKAVRDYPERKQYLVGALALK